MYWKTNFLFLILIQVQTNRVDFNTQKICLILVRIKQKIDIVRNLITIHPYFKSIYSLIKRNTKILFILKYSMSRQT